MKLLYRSFPLIFQIAFIFLFSVTNSFSQSPEINWAVKPTGSSIAGNENGRSLAIDNQGNKLVTGYFGGSITFGNILLTSGGHDDIFVAKYDASGNVLWARKAGGSGFDYSYDIAVDGAGNSYITGRFSGGITFDSITLTGTGYTKMFLAKYDAAGNFIWATKVDGTARTIGYGLAVDATGNCVVTGAFTGTSNFGSYSLTSAGSSYNDIFTARFNSSGNVLWAVKAGGTETNEGMSVALDNSGNSYVTGSFSGSANFSGTILMYSNWLIDNDIFLVKYDSTGNQLWVKSAGGAAGSCKAYDVAVDGAGNAYLTGYMSGNVINFDNISFNAPGRMDAFIAKYSPAGAMVWARQASGTDHLESYTICVDITGNSFISGYFKGTASFGSLTIVSNGLTDFFLTKYDAQGNEVWVEQGGGLFYDEGRGVAINNSGDIFVTGHFSGSATFSGTTLQSSGNSLDMFLAKYNNAGNLIWINNPPSTTSFNTGSAIALDAQGNSYVVGYFSDNITFGNTTFTSYGSTDIFLAKYDATGTIVWARQSGGHEQDYGIALAVNSTGDCFITGYFSDSALFDGNMYTGGPARNFFVAKYDSQGNFNWMKHGGYTHGSDIALDSAGNSYVVGAFSGTATFDSTSVSSNGFVNIFLAKYSSTGNLAWVKSAGGTNQDYGYAVAVDGTGSCYISGLLYGPAIFDTISVNNIYGGTRGFLAKYTFSGAVEWVKTVGDSIGTGVGYDIVTDATGNIFMTGRFGGTIDFGTTSVTSFGGPDAFLCKYNPAGNVMWATNGGGLSDDHANRLAIDREGNCYLIGHFWGSAAVGSYSLAGYGNQDIFVTKIDSLGQAVWAISLGGTHYDYGNGIAVDSAGNCFITGSFWRQASFGNTSLTSAGKDCFIAKIGTVTNPVGSVGEGFNFLDPIKIYPNPFQAEIIVEGNTKSADPAQYTLFNLMGIQFPAHIVDSATPIGKAIIRPDISLPSGVYLLRIKNGADTKVYRLVKQ